MENIRYYREKTGRAQVACHYSKGLWQLLLCYIAIVLGIYLIWMTFQDFTLLLFQEESLSLTNRYFNVVFISKLMAVFVIEPATVTTLNLYANCWNTVAVVKSLILSLILMLKIIIYNFYARVDFHVWFYTWIDWVIMFLSLH